MHELAIAQAVARIASEHAAGARVAKVTLTVGRLRQVVPSALRFDFELVAAGTPLAGAELEIVEIETVGRCNDCGAESTQRTFPFRCAGCGGLDLDVVAGEELFVESLELAETAEVV